MAIACFLLVTFLPLPLFSVPFLRFRIVDSTSFFHQDDTRRTDRVAGLKNSHEKKIEAAKWTRELDLPLTVNAGRTSMITCSST